MIIYQILISYMSVTMIEQEVTVKWNFKSNLDRFFSVWTCCFHPWLSSSNLFLFALFWRNWKCDHGHKQIIRIDVIISHISWMNTVYCNISQSSSWPRWSDTIWRFWTWTSLPAWTRKKSAQTRGRLSAHLLRYTRSCYVRKRSFHKRKGESLDNLALNNDPKEEWISVL